jgi:hypothetical protein
MVPDCRRRNVVLYGAMSGTPSSESAIFPLLREFAKTYIGPAIAVVCAIILHPFNWFTTVTAVLIVLGSILLAYVASRRRQSGRSSRSWQVAAALLGCAVFPWVAVSPFLLETTTPLYVCESSTGDPTATFVEPLIVNGRRIASLLFIADPARKSSAFKWLAFRLAGRRLREIRSISVAGRRYYEMPLASAVRKVAPSPSASVDKLENVKIIYHGPSASVNVVGPDKMIGVSLGLAHLEILNWTGPKSKPWYAVPIDGSGEPEAFRYTARLDSGLAAVEVGDYSTALALMEDAGLHSPNIREKARTLALMANVTYV